MQQIKKATISIIKRLKLFLLFYSKYNGKNVFLIFDPFESDIINGQRPLSSQIDDRLKNTVKPKYLTMQLQFVKDNKIKYLL